VQNPALNLNPLLDLESDYSLLRCKAVKLGGDLVFVWQPYYNPLYLTTGCISSTGVINL
jgi:hypothetical protein